LCANTIKVCPYKKNKKIKKIKKKQEREVWGGPVLPCLAVFFGMSGDYCSSCRRASFNYCRQVHLALSLCWL